MASHNPAPLRWERQKDGALYGSRGGHVLAMIVFNVHGRFAWSVEGAQMKWIAKSYGEAKTEAGAKRSANRAWAAWCSAMELRA